MVRHIVCWNYRDGFLDNQNKEIALKIKKELENLVNKIDGLIEIKVLVNIFSTSNKDIVLNSLFKNEQALASYQIHPEHKQISEFVGKVMQNRVCIDFLE
jgi:hypothetical protein